MRDWSRSGDATIVMLASAPAASASALASLDAHFATRARLTLVHIVPNSLFALLVPLQFVSSVNNPA